MSDDKPTPNTDEPVVDLEAEKAAKIAAAEAKAAAAKKAAEDAPPKNPWEEKPVPPVHSDAMDDDDVVALKDLVISADLFTGAVTATVEAEKILDVCRFLKEERGYAFLVDLTAIDWPEREEGRFDIIYWLHRHEDSKRLRLRAILGEEQTIQSVESIWGAANWMEREVYDLFGVIFENHPGLERILTWEGFNGHPLRKDFPVEGIDTGAAIYPDVYPPGGGPIVPEEGEGA
jgi:NADH-quinone oxidoreductase subunit C